LQGEEGATGDVPLIGAKHRRRSIRLQGEEGTTGDVPLIEAKHRRRSIRLQGSDYSEPGGYFVTICAAGRNNLFGRIENGRVCLNALGEVVLECWLAIPEHFSNADLKEFIVMPNHMHGIVVLGVGARYIVPSDGAARKTESFQKPTKATIPTIVRTFEAAVTRMAVGRLGKRGGQIWQRNYFERVLRDGQEYADASRYILENPQKWEWDKQNLQAKMARTGTMVKFE
jgi:REP element-mobilizing transposase RayT